MTMAVESTGKDDIIENSNGHTNNNTEKEVIQEENLEPVEDLNQNEVEINELIPTPPDGGWGWVVVVSSFGLQFILDGISYAFASFMSSYQEYFNSTAAQTSALMSCLMGCYMLSAPIASALINKFGCRPVGIAGSVMACIAFIISTFSGSLTVMILLFGVLGGVGFGLMYMPAVMGPSIYFDKKRSIAVGIGMCGSGVGTLTMGPIGKILLQNMDWKSAHYILAGVIINGVIFSALIRPLTTKHDRSKLKKKNKEENLLKTVEAEPIELVSYKADNLEQTVKLASNLSIGRRKHTSGGSAVIVRSSTKLGSEHKISTLLTTNEVEDLKRPIYRKDVFYSGSVCNLNEYKENKNIHDYTASVVSVPAVNRQEGSGCKCLPKPLADTLLEMLDFSLFLDLRFNIIALLSFLVMLVYLIPFAFSSVRAEKLGFDELQSSYIILFLGLSTTIGRPVANAISQIPCVKPLYVHNMCLLLASISCIIVPFCKTIPLMGLAAFCYGFFIGGHVSLSPIVLVDFLGLEKLTSAYGIMTLVRGISTLAGPPIAGKMYDQFGSYDYAFYMAGAVIFVTFAGFCTMEMKCYESSQKQSQEQEERA